MAWWRYALYRGVPSSYPAPGRGLRGFVSPCLSGRLSVCLCVGVCVRPIFWYLISRLLEEI